MWFCRISIVGSWTFSAQGTSNLEIGASLLCLHMGLSHLESNGPLYVESFQACQCHIWCRRSYCWWVFHSGVCVCGGGGGCLYAISLNAGVCNFIGLVCSVWLWYFLIILTYFFMLLLRQSRDWLADVVVFWIWLLNDKLLLISTPKYLSLQLIPKNGHAVGTGLGL